MTDATDVTLVVKLPADVYAALARMVADLRRRGRSDMTIELLAAGIVRIGLGACTAEALDSPETLDRLGSGVIDLFLRGAFR